MSTHHLFHLFLKSCVGSSQDFARGGDAIDVLHLSQTTTRGWVQGAGTG